MVVQALITTTIAEPVEASAPVITGVPTISGTAQEGQTLTASPASVTGEPTPTREWQWKSNGANVGTDSTTYVLQASDVGNTITVTQTETNASGSDSATSAATATISAAPTGEGTIQSISVTDQNAAGEIDVSYSIDSDSLVYLALTTTSTPLSAANVQSGTGAVSNSSDNWTTSGGTDTLPPIDDGLASGTYYLQAVAAGGTDGEVVVSNGFTLETILPTVTNAETNVGGNKIVLTMSEPVTGTSDPADWTASGLPNVIAVTIIEQTTEITLTLDAVYEGTDSITLEYSGGDIADAFNNGLADAIGGGAIAVTNGVPAGYTDNLVNVPANRYMTLSTGPSDTTTVFLFWSGIHSMNSRGIIVNWDLNNSRFWVHDNTEAGIEFKMGASTEIGYNLRNNADLSGVRYHVLASCNFNTVTNTLEMDISYRHEGSGLWITPTIPDVTGVSGTAMSHITSKPGVLFGRQNSVTEDGFAGQQARLAVWVGNNAVNIADPTSATVRDAFVDDASGLTIDPDTSHTLLAGAGVTRILDLYGDAARYQLGLNDGTLTMTPNETGTNFTNAA